MRASKIHGGFSEARRHGSRITRRGQRRGMAMEMPRGKKIVTQHAESENSMEKVRLGQRPVGFQGGYGKAQWRKEKKGQCRVPQEVTVKER
ncbi:hypothetical protein E2562_015497 [Oryza meyeriana var. granulata]|uniref:Uncharacterized protein n=1 Tax=Oryza meyeriana var. granulata TaxID=110450 RepID=A0A6G1CQC1_9ORYZ|nr:hypothetical protein E2562_015497 [Oryza meyeriana var. granulata]